MQIQVTKQKISSNNLKTILVYLFAKDNGIYDGMNKESKMQLRTNYWYLNQMIFIHLTKLSHKS